MIFTREAHLGKPVFRPMDPITIWLQRIRNKPVQVFTGYLDSAPYLQLYPGTCTITASCTLKRLLHTYWDPALPYVNGFMREYGWFADRSSGTLTNVNAQSKKLGEDEKGDPQLTDGSIGKLLFATLKHIGDWDPKTIHIEKLPPKLIRRLSDVYYAFAEDAEEVKDDFESFLKKYIGEASQGSAGGGDSGNFGEAAVPRTVYCTGKAMGVSEKFLLCAMMTGLVEAPDGKGSFGNPTGGDLTGVPGAPATRQSSGWRQETKAYYGQFDRTDVKAASRRFFNECKTKDRGQDAGTLAQDVQRSAYPAKYPAVRGQAEKLLAAVKSKGCNRNEDDAKGPGGDRVTDRDGSSKGPGGDRVTDRDTSSSSVQVRTASDRTNSRSGGDTPGKRVTLKNPRNFINRVIVPLAVKNNMGSGNSVAAVDAANARHSPNTSAGYPSDHKGPPNQAWAADISDGGSPTPGMDKLYGDIGKVFGKTLNGARGSGPQPFNFTHNGWRIQLIYRDGGAHDNHIHIGVKGNGSWTGVPGTTSGDSGGDGGDDDGDGTQGPADMMPIAKAAAFVQQMEFPGIMETIESIGLKGPKSLMNDVALFPFIEQLSGAALRNFQSLPNGDFFAFYPDYFGSEKHRSPYWLINDIEILEGKIQLNDDTLCTHMFVVGDTSPGYGSAIDKYERLVSTGVINIYNFAQSGFVAGNTKEDKESREAQVGRFKADPGHVVEFLAKYGARPVLEDAPLVKSPFFEAFLAYQKFQIAWSHQFLTDFQFTFMPEVYPGGLLGFPEHGLQCYIDEVTHSFNYESGFTTTASLSSPASLNGNLEQDPLQHGMVRAFANTSETETTATKTTKTSATKK